MSSVPDRFHGKVGQSVRLTRERSPVRAWVKPDICLRNPFFFSTSSQKDLIHFGTTCMHTAVCGHQRILLETSYRSLPCTRMCIPGYVPRVTWIMSFGHQEGSETWGGETMRYYRPLEDHIREPFTDTETEYDHMHHMPYIASAASDRVVGVGRYSGSRQLICNRTGSLSPSGGVGGDRGRSPTWESQKCAGGV